MARDYAIYDVFTDTALTGNGLAVVFDAEGLDAQRMQAIAREFNLSETSFVLPPESDAHTARVRIFTPGRELPFAGHPTVGTAIALAERHGQTVSSSLMVLEENVGPVRCALHGGDVAYAEFDVPLQAVQMGESVEPEAIAAALGLSAMDIGFENHHTTIWSAANSFAYVPVRNLGAAMRIQVDAAMLDEILPMVDGHIPEVFAYCRDTVGHDCAFHGRMFAPGMGIPEDPATGSAVASFAGVIALFDGLAEGPNEYWIEQGIEMGRASRIRLEITARNGEIASSRIGGHAVRVAEGKLFA